MEDTFRFVVLRARLHLHPRPVDQLGYQTRQMHLQLRQNFLQWHCCRCFEGDICEKARRACTEFRDNCPDEHHPTPPPVFTWRKLTLAKRVTRLGEVPHFTCERNREIKRDCMERLVTPPRQGTSPSRGPPPPCEQALRLVLVATRTRIECVRALTFVGLDSNSERAWELCSKTKWRPAFEYIFGVKSGFERGNLRMHGFISYCQFSKVKNFYVSKLQEADFIMKLLLWLKLVLYGCAALNDGFLLNALKTLFRLSRVLLVLLELLNCILLALWNCTCWSS